MAVAIDVAGYMEWFPIAMTLFAIVMIVLGIMYMLAKIFSKPDWEARVRIEFMRMIVSAIFVVIISGFVLTLGSAVEVVTQGEDPFTTAKSYLARFSIGSTTYDSIPYNVNILWSSARDMRSKTTLISPLPSCVGGACFSQYSGWSYIAGNLEAIATLSIPFAASLIIQLITLDFIQKFFLALLMPAGFILKILPATRDAGAYLISLAVAFYFVFPMVYVMGDQIHSEMGKTYVKQLESMAKSEVGNARGYGEAFDDSYMYGCDNCGDSIVAITRIAYIAPYAVTLPLLALILSLAAARSLFPVFSKDFIGEVNM